MKKIISIILIFSLVFSLTACNSKNTKEVSKEVQLAEDTFSAPIEMTEIIDFSKESNNEGLKLFRNSTDENKLISPVSFFNTTIEIANLVDKTEEEELAKASNYSDMKNFINSYLQELIIDDSIWIDTDTAQEYGTYSFGTEDANVNFFLVNSESSDINLMMNNYLKDNIGIKSAPINNLKSKCQLLSTSYLKSNILLNGNITSISEETINDKKVQAITASNTVLKVLNYDDLTVIELPIESVNKNLVIDIFITKNNLDDFSNEEISDILNKISESPFTLVNKIKLLTINDTFNENDEETYKTSGLTDIFSNFKIVTDKGETQNFNFDKINLVSSVELTYLSTNDEISFENTIDSLEVSGSFPFIIQDPTNNLILFARN